jgi:hypothetical protein
MAEGIKKSRFSSTFLNGVAQACAFMAAPLLTAAIGIGVRYGFGFAAELAGGAAVMTGLVPALFIAGGLFAVGAIVANYKSNQARKYEQTNEVERCVEKAIEQHQPDLSLGQANTVTPRRNWSQYIAARRDASTQEISH